MRSPKMPILALVVVLFLSRPATSAGTLGGDGKKNVLFIVADDMRPSLSPYGLLEASTPNMQRLADEGILFRHAYVQFSYCAPSRNSFMSGRRPDATKVYNFIDHFREDGVGQNWTALPEHFKNNGYLVTGVGKLYHPGVPPNYDEPRSWSQKGPTGQPWPFVNTHGGNSTNLCKDNCCGSNDTSHYCLWDLKPDTFLEDQVNSAVAWDRLEQAIGNYKDNDQPFFVGMGFHRPHLPWSCPKEFYDAIPVDVEEASHKAWPADVPHLHFHDCAEMSHPYWDTTGFGTPIGQGDYFTAHQAEMRRAYYGCVAYIDHLIGQALEILDRTDMVNDTVVVVTGDHGWHLGEHDMWCKMTTLELGTRTPLIFRAPWLPAKGVKTSALAELVDLYPTLTELAGLTLPTPAHGGEYLTGTSLVPIFHNPDTQIKEFALSQMPRCWQNNTHHAPDQKPGDENNRTVSWESMSDCHWTTRDGLDFMGYRMRTANFSITQWVHWDGNNLRPLWNQTVGVEFYNHTSDTGMAPAAFDDFENVNLADKPELQGLVKQMLEKLQATVESFISPNP